VSALAIATAARRISLRPGELFFDRGAVVADTLLGSCVAITLWHREKKVGGMCHYLLAHRDQYRNNLNHPCGHYASDVVAYFLKQCRKHNLAPGSFEVKLFGGGNMCEELEHTPVNVAHNNMREGRSLLLQNGFQIRAEDMGGIRYRKIYFELETGDVWVQYGKDRKSRRACGGV
jgi:chemotaxis protein CheD